MIYGYMKTLTVEGGSYNVIRIGGETLEELVGKRNMYIENGYEESTVSEWLDDGGTPDEAAVPVSEIEPTYKGFSVIAPDVYSDL